MEILKVENLSKIYGNKLNVVKAIDDISFSIEEGDFVAIVGKSGSGKSTLLHMLGGVDRPTSGKVYISGEDIYAGSSDKLTKFRRDNIGIIYQFFNLLPILSTEENISLAVNLAGEEVEKETMNRILKDLGLEERRKNLPNQLSGGQQQRVSIGRAICNEPAILLADEPTGNLDTKNARDIIELLKKANEERKQTIIMITHDEELAKETKRIITISDGKIVSDERVR